MTPDEIPQELLDILDDAAGKTHSRDGQVAAALAKILTRYGEMLAEREQADPKVAITLGPPPPPEVRVVPVPVVWPMGERRRRT